MENRKRAGRAVKGYTISSVAERFGLHPQTLRMYEREGLIKPFRSGGNTRYYSDLDLERLETILTLTRDMGVNLAGVDIILVMLNGCIKGFGRKDQILKAPARTEGARAPMRVISDVGGAAS